MRDTTGNLACPSCVRQAVTISRAIVLWAAIAGVASAADPPDIPRLLGPFAEDGARTEVLVLGTVHLAQDGQPLNRDRLRPVLEALERFRPTVICVEHLAARDIEDMGARGGTFRQVAEMFAQNDIEHGRRVRRRLGVSRRGAAARAEALLAPETLPDASRRELVALLLAAYEAPSALLHWSLLPPAARRPDAGLPADVVRYLDRALASPNEIASLAVPLARTARLRRLVSVDSQWDGARLLQEPEPAIEEAFGHALKKDVLQAGIYLEQRRLAEGAPGDSLLPLYRFINSPEYGAEDAVAQWSPWLRMRLASGVDRLRYGNWESRNARIVANLTDVTSSPRRERVLLLIGVAHKPFVEDLLRRMVHVRVTPFAALTPQDQQD